MSGAERSLRAGSLAQGLAGCVLMRRLTQRANEIGDQGVVNLAGPLRLFEALEYLDMGRNRVGGVGAARLAEGLRACWKLRHLDLTCNRF